MTWPLSENKHGVCGHLFEIFDYYLLLKSIYKIKILIGEPMNIEDYIESFTDKYSVDDTQVEQLIKDTEFADRPKILIGKNILFVDGLIKTHFQEYGVILKFENILTFRCCNKCTHHDLHYNNIKLLQDNRVYNDLDSNMSINYVKKINFKKYKPVKDRPAQPTALIYVTQNCRYMSSDSLMNIVEQYAYDRYIVITDRPDDYNLPRCTVIKPPVHNLYSLFTDYIYTPIQKKFDCSPRLPAECAFYNKDVIYHEIDEAYLESDSGLRVRMKDIQRDINTISLELEDDIINIIDGTI